MADKKISALTAAATPLAGTEVLPIVQSGSTVKVSAANLTAGRTVSAANYTIEAAGKISSASDLVASVASSANSIYFGGGGTPPAQVWLQSVDTAIVYVNGATRLTTDNVGNHTVNTGNLVIGTAAKGIDFSANTNPAGMTSELLNYYAEGTGTATRSGFTEVLGGGTITSTYYYTRVGRTVFMNITLVCAGGASISWAGSGTAVFTGLPFTAATYAVGQWLNTTNLSTTGPTAWISTAMYVAGAAATITTDNSFSFSGTFNV